MSELTIILAFVIIIILIKAMKEYSLRKIQYKERLSFLEKGQALPLEKEMNNSPKVDNITAAKCAKTRGVMCIALSVGIAAAFALMSILLKENELLTVSALSLIVFFCGIGFFIQSLILKKG